MRCSGFLMMCTLLGLIIFNGFVFADTTAQPPVTPGNTGGAMTAAPSGSQVPDAMTDILDIKPPEAIGFDHRIMYWILGVIGVLLLIVLIFFLVDHFLKKRKKKEQQKEAPLPPDVLALRDLEQLEKDGFSDARDFYFRLTAILKMYLDGRFSINAPEMTTEELLPRINDIPVEKKLAGELKELLKRSDPVKFAGMSQEKDKLMVDFSFAHSFIKQTPPVDPQGDLPEKP